MSEAVYRAFSGRRSGPDRELKGMSVADLARTVRATVGTQKAAAAALGVTPSTFRRWESGAVKSPKGIGGLQRAARAAIRRGRMGPRKEARIRRQPPWSISGVLVISADRRRRTVRFGQMPDAGGRLSPVLDRYLAGDDQGAAAALAHAMGGRGGLVDPPEPLGLIPGIHAEDDQVDAFDLGGA